MRFVPGPSPRRHVNRVVPGLGDLELQAHSATRRYPVSDGPPDPECVGKPYKNKEKPGICGLGVELALLLPAFARLGRRRLTG